MKFKLVVCLLLVLGLAMSISMAQKPLRFANLVSNMANPFFVTMDEGSKAAAERFGVDVVTFDAVRDPALQTKQMEDAIAAKFDAILLNPTDVEALVPAVKKANAAGIPVFSLDRDVIGGERVVYIGTSNVAAAELGAYTMLGYLATSNKLRPWRVVILEGIPGASSAIEREEGFKNILNPFIEKGDVEIVADLTANFDRAQGLSVMEDILARTKDIDAVICANDEMCLGALRAIEGAGLKAGFPDGIIMVGFDAIDDAVKAVEEGKFVATIAQAPYIMGYWGVEAAYRYLTEGWEPPEVIYEPTGARWVATPVVVVIKENVETFAEIAKPAVPPPLPGK